MDARGRLGGPGAGPAADPATVYRVGSISKTVAVVTALRLAERGLLALDEPVARLVPEVETTVAYADQPRVITLRELATHTSGLAREPRIRRLLAGTVDEWEETLLGAIPATRFAHPPGACFDYSNVGAAILGLAVRRAGGMGYPDLVAAEVCAPLGLARPASGRRRTGRAWRPATSGWPTGRSAPATRSASTPGAVSACRAAVCTPRRARSRRSAPRLARARRTCC